MFRNEARLPGFLLPLAKLNRNFFPLLLPALQCFYCTYSSSLYSRTWWYHPNTTCHTQYWALSTSFIKPQSMAPYHHDDNNNNGNPPILSSISLYVPCLPPPDFLYLALAWERASWLSVCLEVRGRKVVGIVLFWLVTAAAGWEGSSYAWSR